MSGQISLEVDAFQHGGTPFEAEVNVPDVPAGAKVTVTLTQTRGRKPFYSGTKDVDCPGGGVVAVTFDVKLNGPTRAVLVADASDDKTTPYTSDTKDVQVQ